MAFNLLEFKLENQQTFYNQLLNQWNTDGFVVAYLWHERINLPMPESYLSLYELLEMKDLPSDSPRLQQFLCSRWLLKTILAKILNCEASSISFSKGPLGKLYSAEENESHGIDFNLSHTNEVSLIGIAKNKLIGVDVEKKESRLGKKDVAERFFQKSEYEWIKKALDLKDQDLRFYRLWSLKEAIVKSIGGGVFQNLKHFTLNMELTQIELVSNHEPWSDKDCWELIEISDIFNHVCSVALFSKSPLQKD